MKKSNILNLLTLFLVITTIANASVEGDVFLKPGTSVYLSTPSKVVCSLPVGELCQITKYGGYCNDHKPWLIVYARTKYAVAQECYESQSEALGAYKLYKETGQCY